MQFETRALGKIEIEADRQFFFPEGLFAFEALKHFALLPTKSGSTFHWLQSLEEARLAFLITMITEITTRYNPNINPEHLKIIEAPQLTHAEIWGIITVPTGKPESMTINLQGPVLINRAKKLGAQFVSEDPNHLVRTPLLDLVDPNPSDEKHAQGHG
jgi:flagellar assembly factor FliW